MWARQASKRTLLRAAHSYYISVVLGQLGSCGGKNTSAPSSVGKSQQTKTTKLTKGEVPRRHRIKTSFFCIFPKRKVDFEELKSNHRMAEKLNEFAGKFGKGGAPKGLGVGMKLLAVAAAGFYGIKESMYTGIKSFTMYFLSNK